MSSQLLLPFSEELPERDSRSRAGQIVRALRSWDPGGGKGRYWHLRFSTTWRRMETEAIRAKHPDWSARKVDTMALESAKPYGDPNVIRHYATAIPHGTFPGEVAWLNEPDIASTGLSWRIPPWNEIHGWFASDGNRSEYVDQINAFSQTSPGAWRHTFYPPLKGEGDLVRLLAGVDAFWAHYLQHGTFPLPPASGREPSLSAKTEVLSLFA